MKLSAQHVLVLTGSISIIWGSPLKKVFNLEIRAMPENVGSCSTIHYFTEGCFCRATGKISSISLRGDILDDINIRHDF